jgi:ATP-dependent helicase/DNAse subunit B
VPGGVRVFQDQAACPFRAFAAHRLRAAALEEPAPGLPATLRGTLAHDAMARAWAELVSHEVLCGRDETALRRLAEGAAAGAVATFAERWPHWRESALLDLERRRLGDLVFEVLRIERARAPFAVVKREEKLPARFGGLEIEARLDRMDRLAAGGHVVIDYKSGDVSLGAWFGARPDEPQLPLYCAAAPQIEKTEPIAAVAFLRLSRKALNDRVAGAPKIVVGLAQAEGTFPKADFPGVGALADPKRRGHAAGVADLATLIETWRGVLDGLGRAFREGDARVDPKVPPGAGGGSCRICPYPALCRVHELIALTDSGEQAEGEPPGEERGDG